MKSWGLRDRLRLRLIQLSNMITLQTKTDIENKSKMIRTELKDNRQDK